MEHKLSVLVRLDIDPTSIVLEVSGCLTLNGCRRLVPLIQRAAMLGPDQSLAVNLAMAGHIDAEALEYLRALPHNADSTRDLISDSIDIEAGFPRRLRIEAPDILPLCPSLIPAAGYAQGGGIAAATGAKEPRGGLGDHPNV